MRMEDCSVSLHGGSPAAPEIGQGNLKGIKEEKPKGVTMACSLKPFRETGFPKMVTVYNNKGYQTHFRYYLPSIVPSSEMICLYTQ